MCCNLMFDTSNRVLDVGILVHIGISSVYALQCPLTGKVHNILVAPDITTLLTTHSITPEH